MLSWHAEVALAQSWPDLASSRPPAAGAVRACSSTTHAPAIPPCTSAAAPPAVFDGFAGWDPAARFKIRVVCARPYHALFMNNMLIR